MGMWGDLGAWQEQTLVAEVLRAEKLCSEEESWQAHTRPLWVLGVLSAQGSLKSLIYHGKPLTTMLYHRCPRP